MPDFSFALAFASFFAGFLMFLAPCTLPLIPAYIAFIGGMKEKEMFSLQNQVLFKARVRINAFAFVLGFSAIFIFFGIVAGYLGSFIGSYKILISQLGGVVIIIFGLMMLQLIRYSPFKLGSSIQMPSWLTPGKPQSAFCIGAIFALGWTPCIGPILASILLLASISATALSGALYLILFSIGLSIPFLLTAFLFSNMSKLIYKYSYLSSALTTVGGVFLVFIGLLLLFGNFGLTLQYGQVLFELLHIDGLLRFY